MSELASGLKTSGKQLAGSTALAISVGIAVLTLSVPLQAIANETAVSVPSEPLTVVRLPANVQVLKTGIVTMEKSEEWSTVANANLDTALEELVGQSVQFRDEPLPDIEPGEQALIDEYLAVARLVLLQLGGQHATASSRVYRGATRRTLGPELEFLRDRTGADFAIGAIGLQLEQTKSVTALDAISTVATIFLPPFVGLPSVSSSYSLLFLLELRTGELTWFNARSGYEVSGYNFTDLRDPKSARKVLTALFEPYPETRFTPAASTRTLPPKAKSPTQRTFAINVPSGWRALRDIDSVTATRDGGMLNEIKVSYRTHGQSFSRIEERSSSTSTPQRLAELYARDLGLRHLIDLRIVETTFDSQLAGRPAFRMLVTHRLPAQWGGATIEQVVLGAATRDGLLLAELSAPKFNYFADALPAFEHAAASIVVKRRPQPLR